MKKRRMGGVLIALGFVMIAVALGLTGYNLWDGQRAEQAAQSVLEQLKALREEAASPGDAQGSEVGSSSGDDAQDSEETAQAVEIDGYRYIGVLQIPALNLELPVMETWDYKRLRIAPCRYMGSAEGNDLIIAAHNYSTHFGNLKNLRFGDEVFFRDLEGKRFRYEVSMMEMLDGTAVEEMESGEWDLTLFTCTVGGQARVTVRCTASEQE